MVLDGIGWDQLQLRKEHAPFLAAMGGGPITSVAPTTTACALSSITLGATPAEHGVIGYRVAVDEGVVLNVLRWRTADGDARDTVPAREFQSRDAFAGRAVPVVTRAEFRGSGFSDAHLRGAALVGYGVASSIAVEVRRLLAAGEQLVYAYYDGIDKTAHGHGFGEHYDAELRSADRLVEDIAAMLPAGGCLLVTSDHGQVEVGPRLVALDKDLLKSVRFQSGEGRFRWLHAVEGETAAVARQAHELYGDRAWVRTREEAEAEGWFGGRLSPVVASRVGDVALAAPHRSRSPTLATGGRRRSCAATVR